MQNEKFKLVIHYCTLCQWMLRSAWLAQEVLTTFSDEAEEVALRPTQGGVFEIWVNNICIWERRRDGGFPSAKELKNRIRDAACPAKALGEHITRERAGAVQPVDTDAPQAEEGQGPG